MVLSALVPSGVLSGWMYHVQNPPPSHTLDLVFPVFIFCMGVAIPLAGAGKDLLMSYVAFDIFVMPLMKVTGVIVLYQAAYPFGKLKLLLKITVFSELVQCIFLSICGEFSRDHGGWAMQFAVE